MTVDARDGVEDWAHRVEAFAEEVRRSPARVAEVVAVELRRTAAAGAAPDGTPWKPRADGKPALRAAAQKIRVVASGSTVVATLAGVEARHSLGRVRGHVRRPILPARGAPSPMLEAVRDVYRAAWGRTVGGTR